MNSRVPIRTLALVLIAALAAGLPPSPRAFATSCANDGSVTFSVSGSQCLGYITSGTSWTLPSDWQSSGATIEAVGPGGDGANGTGARGGGAGQGGGYGKVTSPANLSPGDTVTVQVGAHGSTDATFVKDDTGAVLAEGDYGASGAITAGGDSAQSGNAGDSTHTGGEGGSAGMSEGGAGGGGAGGPNGDGAQGGSSTSSGGSGGGGASGGSAGTGSTNFQGQAGGDNSNSTGGGGVAGAHTAGNPGTAASPYGGAGGGGAGLNNTDTNNYAGGAGAIGEEWDSTHGTGGGGGGGGSATASHQPGDGGAGGAYGGGGGGGGPVASGTDGVGGDGGNGLIVIRYTPSSGASAPSVTTGAPSGVSATAATANGIIVATGGATPDDEGFVYDTVSHGAPGNVAAAASGYAHFASTTGSFSVGAFTKSLSGLSAGSQYYLRAFAHNSAGYSYGDEVWFTTMPAGATRVIRLAGARLEGVRLW